MAALYVCLVVAAQSNLRILLGQQVCSNPQYRAATQFLLKTINNLLPGHGAVLEDIGELLNSLYLPRELAEEIQGCAAALGITPGIYLSSHMFAVNSFSFSFPRVGWATLFNLGYEATSDCTSIVAQAADGTILHARNMDFGAGMGFTDILRNLTFGNTLSYSVRLNRLQLRISNGVVRQSSR